MKNTGLCPKCGGENIVVVDGHAGPYGSGNNIMVGMTIFSAVKVHRYICCDCGFTEEWIDRADTERIVESGKAHRR